MMELFMKGLSVLVAALSTMAIGFLWYSPVMFARPWMVAMGFDPDDMEQTAAMQKSAGPLYAASFFAALITAFVLRKLIFMLHAGDWLAGLQVGLWVWAGFVATVQFTGAIFGKRGFKLLLIDTGYQLACFLAMGAILGAWR